MKREHHTHNGKQLGIWCETESGRRAYLAVRKSRQVHVKRNAWCIDTAILDKCRKLGISIIGVIKRERNMNLVWLTLVEDFFTMPESFAVFDGTRQRGLPLVKFRVDPMKRQDYIEKTVKLA